MREPILKRQTLRCLGSPWQSRMGQFLVPQCTRGSLHNTYMSLLLAFVAGLVPVRVCRCNGRTIHDGCTRSGKAIPNRQTCFNNVVEHRGARGCLPSHVIGSAAAVTFNGWDRRSIKRATGRGSARSEAGPGGTTAVTCNVPEAAATLSESRVNPRNL